MKFFHIFLPFRISLNLILVVIISVTLLSSCKSCVSESPPNWKVCEQGFQNKEKSAENETPATDHLVVYLDTSASMAGYVSPDGGTSFSVAPDGQTIFSKTLLEIRSVVTVLSPQSTVVVRRVDGEISAPSFSNLELSQAALNRSTYNGKETNLAGAIKTFNQPLREGAKEGEEENEGDDEGENKNPPRFHILITDGVQSSSQTDQATSCDKGSDSICVNTQISQLFKAGWSATILGLKSEFKGNVYSEINRSVVPYSTGKDTEKFRPFYLYIFSPDKNALENLTKILRQRFSEMVKSEDSLHEFSLTSAYAVDFSEVEFENLSREFIQINKIKESDKRPPRIRVYVDVETEKDGLKPFQLKVKIPWAENAALAGNQNELLGLINWELELVEPETEEKTIRYPNLKLVKKEIKNDEAELTFETGWTKDAGDFGKRLYRLVGKFDTDQTALPWVKNWSTQVDTTVEAANKTLNLDGSLGNLWKNTSLRNEAIGGACIHVGVR